MKQHELDALIARRENNVKRFFLWFWCAVVPILGVTLFLVFSHNYHPHHAEPPQTPTFDCTNELHNTADIGGGGAIAPLCGATPYPDQGGDG